MQSYFIQLEINPNLYIRDPLQTKLGKKIVQQSIHLIDEVGLEQFTFKKLATKISSSEVSIYRYFENKHHLFVYLLNWYWEWMIVQIDFNTLNLKSPSKRLQIALETIVDTTRKNISVEFVDEAILHRVVVREGAKGYHHKLVDADNQDGFFLAYKRLCNKIAEIIREMNPNFQYPRALASMLVETANNNLYFAKHLPRLTDLHYTNDDKDLSTQVLKLLDFFAHSLIFSDAKGEQLSRLKIV